VRTQPRGLFQTRKGLTQHLSGNRGKEGTAENVEVEGTGEHLALEQRFFRTKQTRTRCGREGFGSEKIKARSTFQSDKEEKIFRWSWGHISPGDPKLSRRVAARRKNRHAFSARSKRSLPFKSRVQCRCCIRQEDWDGADLLTLKQNSWEAAQDHFNLEASRKRGGRKPVKEVMSEVKSRPRGNRSLDGLDRELTNGTKHLGWPKGRRRGGKKLFLLLKEWAVPKPLGR